jgi:hypothetical protein
MKLVEKLMVYKGQYGYSTLLKNNDDKLYVQVGFRKGQEPYGEKAMIDIKDGFLSFYKDKNGFAKMKIVVLDYTELETLQNNNTFGFDDVPPVMSGDDLPF